MKGLDFHINNERRRENKRGLSEDIPPKPVWILRHVVWMIPICTGLVNLRIINNLKFFRHSGPEYTVKSYVKDWPGTTGHWVAPEAPSISFVPFQIFSLDKILRSSRMKKKLPFWWRPCQWILVDWFPSSLQIFTITRSPKSTSIWGQGHWLLIPITGRQNPSGHAVTQVMFQSKLWIFANAIWQTPRRIRIGSMMKELRCVLQTTIEERKRSSRCPKLNKPTALLIGRNGQGEL